MCQVDAFVCKHIPWPLPLARPAACECRPQHVCWLQVNDLAWAPDDALLASCSIDNSIIIWDPASGQRVRTLQVGHAWQDHSIGVLL